VDVARIKRQTNIKKKNSFIHLALALAGGKRYEAACFGMENWHVKRLRR
jgi:hypothetical protein